MLQYDDWDMVIVKLLCHCCGWDVVIAKLFFFSLIKLVCTRLYLKTGMGVNNVGMVIIFREKVIR